MLIGQSNSNKDGKLFLHAQGGYFIDSGFDINYSGFNIGNIGWGKKSGNILQTIEAEFLAFRVDETVFSQFNPDRIIEKIENRRTSLEMIYSYSFLFDEDISGFILGPTASILINSRRTKPLASTTFPLTNTCFCASLGVNLGYQIKLNKNIGVLLSSRSSLLDIGLDRQLVENPILTETQRRTSAFDIDLIRDQFQVMLGIRFRI